VAGHGDLKGAASPDDISAVQRNAPPGPSAASAPPHRAIRLLLVDDNEELTSATERALRRHGIVVESACDGTTALELLVRTDCDVIVSDVVMPGLDGVALLRAAREHDLDVPVILITGAPDVHTAARAVEYGGFRYLM
jgi:DNA-binding NtrC family response regulator